jgi:hypothetical protein
MGRGRPGSAAVRRAHHSNEMAAQCSIEAGRAAFLPAAAQSSPAPADFRHTVGVQHLTSLGLAVVAAGAATWHASRAIRAAAALLDEAVLALPELARATEGVRAATGRLAAVRATLASGERL